MERIFIGRHDAMNPAGRGRLPGELRKPGEVFRCPAVRRDHRAQPFELLFHVWALHA
jgi:hypothetical protein